MVSDHGDGNGPDRAAVRVAGNSGTDPAAGDTTAGTTGATPGRLRPDRVWLFVTGVLLVTMPAITLVVAYAALSATRSAVLAELTLVEAVELYLVELAAFAVFSYLLYRLTMYTSSRHAAAAEERAGGEEAR
jgi:hypothetical protein